MATTYTITKPSNFSWNFWIIGVPLLAGLLLSVLSWLEICVQHCSATLDYRLFGFPFAFTGIPFFLILNGLHFSSKNSPLLTQLTGWAISGALGAEIFFTLIQKYQIGHWCPVCLSIALCIAIAGFAFSYSTLKEFISDIQQGNRKGIGDKVKKGFVALSFMVLGFIIAFIGTSKTDKTEAAVTDMKSRLAFGSQTSPVEVFIVTDWFCPSCKKVEPLIEKMIPFIQNETTFYFVDFPIHKKSLNFTPYNIAFLINDKLEYLQARKALSKLTEKTDKPSDKDVQEALNKDHLNFNELSYLDVKTGMDYFDQIIEKYALTYTPTIIITNKKNNQSVKFEGREEISQEKVLKAIESMKSN